MDLVELFRLVPEGIWGVLLGSLLAFGGTYVATRQQLKYDAMQRERDRKMQLRRDVFMEAAEGVTGNTGFFMKFTNVNLPVTEIIAVDTKPGWLNKLYAVASIESIEAFTLANAALGASAFELLRQRLDVEEVNNRITTANEEIETVKAKIEQIRDTVSKAENITATPEVEKARAALANHWAQALEDLTKLYDKLSALQDEHFGAQRRLLESAVTHAIEYQRTLRKALVALRAELELPIDAARLESFVAKIDTEMFPKFTRLLDSIDSDDPDSAG